MADDEELIGLGEAAAVLDVHPNTVRNWGAQGRLWELRVGPRGDRRYRRSDVNRLRADLEAENIRRRQPVLAQQAELAVRYAPLMEAMSRLAPTLDAMTRFTPALEAMTRSAPALEAMTRLAPTLDAMTRFAPTLEGMARLAPALDAMTRPVPALEAMTRFAPALEAMTRSAPALEGITRLAPTLEAMTRFAPALDAMTRLSPVLTTSQLNIASNIGRLASAVPLTVVDDLRVAAVQTRGVLDQIDRVIIDVSSLSVAAQRAVSLVQAFERFSASVANRLPSDASEGAASVAVGELSVGAAVLEGGVSPVRGLAAVAPTDLESTEALVVNVFDEILSMVDQRQPRLLRMQALEVAATINVTLSMRIAKEAGRLLRCRTACSEQAELSGQDPIFKATRDTEDAAVCLPFSIATNGDTFATCVNRLYKLIYESSGGLSRIPDRFKGPASILFTLKHLRTHYFHDVHHGDEADQRKKLRAIGDAYKNLGGAGRPKSSIEWQRLQLALLWKLADILEELDLHLSKIGGQP